MMVLSVFTDVHVKFYECSHYGIKWLCRSTLDSRAVQEGAVQRLGFIR